jgi:hypothetical protein
MISMLQHFGPIMPEGGAAVSLTYLASERVVPGYGGGMSSAKAQLESDTRVLAWEAGRKFGIRVNTISAGPLASRAAVAIKKVCGCPHFFPCKELHGLSIPSFSHSLPSSAYPWWLFAWYSNLYLFRVLLASATSSTTASTTTLPTLLCPSLSTLMML